MIYNRNDRDSESWKRHMMRINASGSFTGQWLFDAAIHTLQVINGKDINGANLVQKDYQDIIDTLISDANKLEGAVGSLSSQFEEPSNLPIRLFMAVPYFHPNNKLDIDGEVYDLSNPERRLAATIWYVNRLNSQVRSKSWRYFDFGVFYNFGTVLKQFNDAQYLVGYNSYVRGLNFESVWVPWYDYMNGYAFKGYQLGFNTIIIQPRYAFHSSIDGGILKGDRLYSTAQKAASLGQCMGYEVRSHGEAEVEYFIAHQYLAVLAQFIMCQKQAFDSGAYDIFDRLTSKASAPGKVWDTYQDLATHLGGQWIRNMETNLATNFDDVSENRKEKHFKIVRNYMDNLNAIRLDFRDYNNSVPWRGKLTILLDNNELRSSYAYRMGTDNIIPEYNSVFVPISNDKVNAGTTSVVVIRLEREEGSPWPYIERMLASQNETLFVANPVAFSVTSSSAEVPRVHYQDSADTQISYASGKLTDGRITNAWWDGNAVGWVQIDRRITITIDLGSVKGVSKIKAYAWKDIPSFVNFPQKMAALAAVDCEPQERGTLAGCVPTASTGFATEVAHRKSCSEHCDRGHYTATFGSSVKARYVTLSFVATAWALLDEVEVLDENNQVISRGMPYRVTPAPGQYYNRNGADQYTNDGQILTDGAIFKDFIFGRNVVGIEPNKGGTVEVVFVKPMSNMNRAIIWMTNEKPGWGIGLPTRIEMAWRTEDGLWYAMLYYVDVKPAGSGVCTASPCAAFNLPKGVNVTGVSGTFPEINAWVMVSEISFM